MEWSIITRKANIIVAPLFVLIVLMGAGDGWSAGSPRPMRFAFAARYTLPPGEDAVTGSQAARDMAFAGAAERAVRVLENQRVVRENALTVEDLKKCVAVYFPPTIERQQEYDLGDKKIFAVRASIVVSHKELGEVVRLWAEYKRKGETPPPRVKKAPPPPPEPVGNGTSHELAANASEAPAPINPLDLPASPEDFGSGASMPSLEFGPGGSSGALAVQQPAEYLSARDLLIQVADLWDVTTFSDPERAYELARLAFIRQPANHVAANNMGVALHGLGEYEQAMDAYTKAIGLKKDFAEGFHNRAQLHYLRGDYDLAINDYSKVLQINSEYINARTHRALAYGKAGDAGLMCSDLETACRMGDCSFFEAAQRLGDCP